MRDIFIEILTTIKHNRLRTALTGFSVAWGIFILIVLLGAGNGLINATMGNSSRYLSTSMVVSGGATSKAYDGLGENRDVQLNDKDFNITSKGFPNNVESVGAELSQQGETLVNGSDYTTGINLSGVYPNDVEINKRTMICGRFINELDLKERRKSIVISSDMAKELLPQSPLSLNGQIIRTTTLAFRVVGIYESQKNSMGNDAFIPFTTFRAIYNKGDKTGNIVFSFSNLNSEAENEAFESDYRARINRQHRAAPDDENAIWIWNRFTQALSMDTATGLLRTALWVIGILTLISGIVGVSNIISSPCANAHTSSAYARLSAQSRGLYCASSSLRASSLPPSLATSAWCSASQPICIWMLLSGRRPSTTDSSPYRCSPTPPWALMSA